MQEFISDIFKTIGTISIPDVIDIACVSVLFYYVYKFLRDRRSGKLAVGVISLIALKFISDFFDMYVIQFILQNVFQVGLIAVAIVFQPELRSALENVGGQPLKSLRTIGDAHTEPTERMIRTVSVAVGELSRSKTGALIVLERSTRLGDLVLTGTVIDSEPSVYLIQNIFFNKAPLHDGALLVRNARLYAAGCLLPLSSNTDIVKDLGTRHRAAIGMSENSDAVVVVVSEETGVISLAVDGVLYRGYTRDTLEEELRRYMLTSQEMSTRRTGRLVGRRFRRHSDKNGETDGGNHEEQ